VRTRTQSVLARLRREEGASVIELAVSCSVLFTMLLGICQLSVGLYAYQFCADAARQATRWAMVRGSTSQTNTPNLSNTNASATDISNYVKGLGYKGISSSSITVTATWCAASSSTPTTWSSCSASTINAPGNLVKVIVAYPVSFHIPFAPQLSLSLSSTSQMVIAQ
jgi:Flp pilus assembly protein TadG